VPTIGDLTCVPSTTAGAAATARRAPQQEPPQQVPQAAAWRRIGRCRRRDGNIARHADFAAAIGHFDFGQARIAQQNRQLAHQRSIDVHAGLDVAARFSFVAHEIPGDGLSGMAPIPLTGRQGKAGVNQWQAPAKAKFRVKLQDQGRVERDLVGFRAKPGDGALGGHADIAFVEFLARVGLDRWTSITGN
jgi:hypothetical protein